MLTKGEFTTPSTPHSVKLKAVFNVSIGMVKYYNNRIGQFQLQRYQHRLYVSINLWKWNIQANSTYSSKAVTISKCPHEVGGHTPNQIPRHQNSWNGIWRGPSARRATDKNTMQHTTTCIKHISHIPMSTVESGAQDAQWSITNLVTSSLTDMSKERGNEGMRPGNLPHVHASNPCRTSQRVDAWDQCETHECDAS